MNKLQMAEQFRKAVQMFAKSLTEEKALEVATVFDPWVVGKNIPPVISLPTEKTV